jgi:hypothetical protein
MGTKSVSALGNFGIALVGLDFEEGLSFQLDVINFNIANGQFQQCTGPVSQSIFCTTVFSLTFAPA